MIDEDDIEPTCDICGEPQDCGRDLCEMHADDWNGDTGNHLSCEQREQRESYPPMTKEEFGL